MFQYKFGHEFYFNVLRMFVVCGCSFNAGNSMVYAYKDTFSRVCFTYGTRAGGRLVGLMLRGTAFNNLEWF